MTKRYCAWGVDSSFRFKWMAKLAGWNFDRKLKKKAKR